MLLLYILLPLPPFTINFVHRHLFITVCNMLLGRPQIEKFMNKIMCSENICIYSFNKLCTTFNSLHRVNVSTHTVHITYTFLGRQGLLKKNKPYFCDMSVHREEANVRRCMVVRRWEGSDNAPRETFENIFFLIESSQQINKTANSKYEKTVNCNLTFWNFQTYTCIKFTWAATSSMTTL